MKYLISFFATCACIFTNTLFAQEIPTEPLDYKSIPWQSLDYSRMPIKGGAALYTIPSSVEKSFRLDLLFPYSIHHVDKALQPTIIAFAAQLLEGGVGNKSYDEISDYLSTNGISIEANLTNLGTLRVSTSGLSKDFPIALKVMEDVLLRPRFNSAALDIWKQQQNFQLQNLKDGANSRKQARFMAYMLNKIAFGSEHYLTQTISRTGPKALNTINTDSLKKLIPQVLNRAGLNAVLSGNFAQINQQQVITLLQKIPRTSVSLVISLPTRPLSTNNNKIRYAIITKPDMKQCSIEMRFLIPHTGELNLLEQTEIGIAGEVLSSTAGVIGNDRWSKALRSESGFSYAPSAFFMDNIIPPNTNVGLWRLSFQSPADKVYDAIQLAQKTFQNFIAAGITEEEFKNSRKTQINQIMGSEKTIFDKADNFLASLLLDKIPSSLIDEETLASLAQVSSYKKVNATLARLSDLPIPVMVIMGNPTAEHLEQLAKDTNFELVEAVQFDNLIKVFD